ncbi:hypothetical protein GN244_ATG12158 [Phytophthora infestans]|uniref:Uncharacterized protein n=1 Tax=Phytophthora infestans TaxID=4787 RepID=A0A833T0F9_PHYIN|nr:hypothetical protein GN244_ATG12158 [Phytophthora infestans]
MASVSAAPDNVVRYDVPNGDFCAYLKGFWKRNLEWRRFGASFKHLRSTNNIVFIEEDLDAAGQPNTQFLRWSFGRTLKQQDLSSAYTVQFIPDEQGTFMEWSFEGVTCHGVFKLEANVAILNFCLQESMVTITYRVLDANTMAVCIVDVDSEHTPTIQYGNMYVARMPSPLHIISSYSCAARLLLLFPAVWKADVDLQWLRYGSVTDFGDWSSDVLDPACPVVDLVLLLVRLSDLAAAHPEFHFSKHSDDVVDDSICHFLSGLERYSAEATAPLVVLLCPSSPTSATAARVDAMERTMQHKIETMQNVSVQSSGQLLSLFEQQYTTTFYDSIADKRQHSPYTQAMLNVMSLSLCRQICRLYRSASGRKKVIVLDCDNTLWGGAVAEVGPSGIDLGPRFLSLQRFVVAQQQRGMLLALCSKNILEDVTEAFKLRRQDMVLDLDKHVIATKVNWQPKSENIAQLAKELSLGLDSVIFIDDNPLECNQVATALPSVTVIPLAEHFPESVLVHEWVFDDGLGINSSGCAGTNTKEDNQRTQLYQQNLHRQQLRESSSTHRAFLSALKVKIVFEELDRDQEVQERSPSYTRVMQLHHRTNQFNTATSFAKRLEEGELLDYIVAPDHTVICAHVTDRFGHYGLVTVALCQHVHDANVLRVDSFLLSCRALNRGVEHAMMRKLSEVAARSGAIAMKFVWEPTERNQPAHTFFSSLYHVAFELKNEYDFAVAGKELSASKTGSWAIATDKGSQVSFLKAEDANQRSIKAGGLISWLLHLQEFALPVVRWMMFSITLPQWLVRLFKPSLVQRLGNLDYAGSLRVPLRDRGSLEQFVTPALHNILSINKTVTIATDYDDSDSDDKFRRKARHQTKMALANHLHGEAPRVIWSANRPHADSHFTVGDDVTVSDSASCLHLVCETPQCSSTIQRESRCAFQRCRSCCYRIQRLLTRTLHHGNAEARQSALYALKAEFAVDVSTEHIQSAGLDTQWCAAHQNLRRRGEMFKQKSTVTKKTVKIPQ